MEEDNLQETQIEENELKKSVKQMIVKYINVKTTSKILSSLHKGMLIGTNKAISACKLAKRELQPFLNYILPKQYTYSSKIKTHQYTNEEKPHEYANFVAVQSTKLLFQLSIYSESWRWICFRRFEGIDYSRVVIECRKLCGTWVSYSVSTPDEKIKRDFICRYAIHREQTKWMVPNQWPDVSNTKRSSQHS